MSVDPNAFRQVMGRFATGVTVVTTALGERRAGITVNAFCSVSLEPPLVLICIEQRNYTHDLLTQAGRFAVNFLTSRQADVSRCFAAPGDEKQATFCGVATHTEATGAPIFDECLAFVDCRLVAVYPGGDHSIIIGQVEALGGSAATPLLYYQAHYGRLEATELDLGPSTRRQ